MSPLRGLNDYCLLASVMPSLRDYIPFAKDIHLFIWIELRDSFYEKAHYGNEITKLLNSSTPKPLPHIKLSPTI